MSVYFVRCNDLIKIGFSSDLPKRVASIISTIPAEVEFIGWMPGDREVEGHLHSRFESARFSGEWFVANEDLHAFARIALDPEMPRLTPPAHVFVDRSPDIEAMRELSARMRRTARNLWPGTSMTFMRQELQRALGWSQSRLKTVWYDERPAGLRQVESDQLQCWLNENSKFDIDPEPVSGFPLVRAS